MTNLSIFTLQLRACQHTPDWVTFLPRACINLHAREIGTSPVRTAYVSRARSWRVKMDFPARLSYTPTRPARLAEVYMRRTVRRRVAVGKSPRMSQIWLA